MACRIPIECPGDQFNRISGKFSCQILAKFSVLFPKNVGSMLRQNLCQKLIVLNRAPAPRSDKRVSAHEKYLWGRALAQSHFLSLVPRWEQDWAQGWVNSPCRWLNKLTLRFYLNLYYLSSLRQWCQTFLSVCICPHEETILDRRREGVPNPIDHRHHSIQPIGSDRGGPTP